jgi:hypothetical protein
LAEVQRLKDNIDKKYQMLQMGYNKIEEENTRKNQEVMNLKRQLTGISNFEVEIKVLEESVNKKNAEIL